MFIPGNNCTRWSPPRKHELTDCHFCDVWRNQTGKQTKLPANHVPWGSSTTSTFGASKSKDIVRGGSVTKMSAHLIQCCDWPTWQHAARSANHSTESSGLTLRLLFLLSWSPWFCRTNKLISCELLIIITNTDSENEAVIQNKHAWQSSLY